MNVLFCYFWSIHYLGDKTSFMSKWGDEIYYFLGIADRRLASILKFLVTTRPQKTHITYVGIGKSHGRLLWTSR